MHLSRTSWLSIISAIFASFCILSCANSTSLTFRNASSKHEVYTNSVSSSLCDPSAFPQSQSNRKRRISYVLWPNGWVSRSYTYSSLIPVLPAAARLSVFYARILLSAPTLQRNLIASTPAVQNGVAGQMVRFQYGGLELRFFSVMTEIPWGFVATVVTRLKDMTAMGFVGLHGSVFVHQAKGIVVSVTLFAAAD